MAHNARVNNGPLEPDRRHFDYLDLRGLGRLLFQQKKTILLYSCVPAAVIFLTTALLSTREWAAQATLRPVNKETQMESFMGIAEASVASGFGGAASLLGMGAESDEAQEYSSILSSFDFSLRVVRQHQLALYILAKRPAWYNPLRWLAWIGRIPSMLVGSGGKGDSDWKIYQYTQDHFRVEFNTETGNLDLTFIDEDPVMARKLLNWMVSDLREILRAHEVESSRNALASLRTEAARTLDVYLQSQLYQFAAVQMENLQMAAAQSDFAFKLIQSPVVPDKPSSPRPVLDAVIAGAVGALGAILWILVAAAAKQVEAGGNIEIQPERARVGQLFINGELPGEEPRPIDIKRTRVG